MIPLLIASVFSPSISPGAVIGAAMIVVGLGYAAYQAVMLILGK